MAEGEEKQVLGKMNRMDKSEEVGTKDKYWWEEFQII